MSVQLEAGREMDVLVAEKVMGLTDIRPVTVIDHRGAHSEPGTLGPSFRMPGGRMGRAAEQLPHFSASIAAARLMEDAVFERGLGEAYCECLCAELFDGDQYPVRFTTDMTIALVRATPLQRCRAALAAMEATP